jgi:phosphatidylinositol glycan class B
VFIPPKWRDKFNIALYIHWHPFINNMKFHQLIFIIAIIWYALTAYLSNGYYHPDEHYQIIEFAGIIEGTNTARDLAWEYNAQIRPAIQPAICYLLFKACDFFSIANPYDKAFLLRLITSLLSVVAIYFFTNSCRNMISNKNWKLFLILSYFIWFLPFINVRFSSESWSGIALLSASALVVRDKSSYQTSLVIGSLLGLSFLFRYQIAFAVLGLVLWLIFMKKEAISKIALILASGLAVVIIGFFIDSWFYGEWVFTFWNYFKVNLIDGKAAEFGTSPWFYYFFKVFRYSYFPIGTLILLSFLLLVFRRYDSIFIWTILPFLIVHSCISHKELRFLFPIINFVPVIIILAIQEVPPIKWINPPGKLIKGLLVLVLMINLVGVIVASTKPAGEGSIRIAQKINEINTKKLLNIFFVNNCNPFSPWYLTTNFYTQKNSEFKKLDFSGQIHIPVADSNARNVFVIRMIDFQDMEIQKFINSMDMKEKCKSVPEFMIPFLKIYGYRTKDIFILYSD